MAWRRTADDICQLNAQVKPPAGTRGGRAAADHLCGIRGTSDSLCVLQAGQHPGVLDLHRKTMSRVRPWNIARVAGQVAAALRHDERIAENSQIPGEIQEGKDRQACRYYGSHRWATVRAATGRWA